VKNIKNNGNKKSETHYQVSKSETLENKTSCLVRLKKFKGKLMT